MSEDGREGDIAAVVEILCTRGCLSKRDTGYCSTEDGSCLLAKAQHETASMIVERLRAGRAADPEAVEAANDLLGAIAAKGAGFPWQVKVVCDALLASASSPDSSRADVVEKCAKVAEDVWNLPWSGQGGSKEQAKATAKAIRALAGGTSDDPQPKVRP